MANNDLADGATGKATLTAAGELQARKLAMFRFYLNKFGNGTRGDLISALGPDFDAETDPATMFEHTRGPSDDDQWVGEDEDGVVVVGPRPRASEPSRVTQQPAPSAKSDTISKGSGT